MARVIPNICIKGKYANDVKIQNLKMRFKTFKNWSWHYRGQLAYC